MAPTLVLYVRHGHTPTTGARLPGRAPDLHLSGEGRAQAEAVARHLADRASGLPGGIIAAVYASPMERAQETAAPIARAVGCRVRTASGLNECDFGTWTGRRLRELRKLKSWATVQDQPSTFRFPKGESFSGMQDRITGQVDSLVSRHAGQAIVCVSHADPLKAILARDLGTPLDLFQRLEVSPCSVSAVLHGSHRPHILGINATGHLADHP